jgi:F-type H+-transporting ATPase subunit delta
MAELATIARPYAEALFKASAADLSTAAGWVDELVLLREMRSCSSLPKPKSDRGSGV